MADESPQKAANKPARIRSERDNPPVRFFNKSTKLTEPRTIKISTDMVKNLVKLTKIDDSDNGSSIPNIRGYNIFASSLPPLESAEQYVVRSIIDSPNKSDVIRREIISGEVQYKFDHKSVSKTLTDKPAGTEIFSVEPYLYTFNVEKVQNHNRFSVRADILLSIPQIGRNGSKIMHSDTIQAQLKGTLKLKKDVYELIVDELIEQEPVGFVPNWL